jgi:hypothetical protein
LPALIAAPGKTRRVFNSVALFYILFYVNDGFPNSKVLSDEAQSSRPA